MEGWSNKRTNPPDYNYGTLGSWDSHFPLPSQAAGVATPELALEWGQQLEKEVAPNQVSRLDVELGLLAAVSSPLHFF